MFLFISGWGAYIFSERPRHPSSPREVSERNIGCVVVVHLPPASSSRFLRPFSSTHPKPREKISIIIYTTSVFIYLLFKIILNLLYPESCCKYDTGQVYIYMYDICVFVRYSYILYPNRHTSYGPSFVMTHDDEHPPISSSTNHAYQTYPKPKHVR